MGKGWWLICIFNVLTILILSCSADNKISISDSLKIGEKLHLGDMLMSKGGYFILEFASINGPDNQYLTIFFRKASSYPIVWIANRDNPLNTSSHPVLSFQRDGNLVLMDDKGKVNSSFHTNMSLMDNKNARIVLLDSGNLVLQDKDSTIVWQSFDFPTDTILPGMKIGYDKTSGNTWSYTARINELDANSGNVTAVLDPNQSGWLSILDGNRVKELFWVGLSNSTHVYSIRSKNIYFNTHIDLQNNTFYSVFEVDDYKDFFVACVLESQGYFQLYYWFKGDQDWTNLMSLPSSICDYYGYCGDNTICNSNSSNPCSCFQEFHPIDPESWAKQIYGGGCQRKTALGCIENNQHEQKFRFIELSNVTMPSNPILLPRVREETDCQSACVANCSCNGFLFSNNENRCWIVAQEVANVQQITSIDVPGVNLHIKLEVSASNLFTTNNESNSGASTP